MITIHNGKLNIPDDDRFVGFAGDNAVSSKQFHLTGHGGESCTYTLCLRFDDDSVRSVPLTAASDGADTVLTWDIRAEQLSSPGVVAAQVRIADSDGSVLHSSRDFFLIGSAVELDEDGAEAEYVTPSQLRNSINQALQTVTAAAPYVDDSGYWCIYDPDTESYIRTGYTVSGLAPDSAVSDSSENTVGNKYIKQYVDGKAFDCNTFSSAYTDQKTADKVPASRKIAQIALSADIGASELSSALLPHLYKENVIPGTSSGKKGQLGIGPSREVYCCTADNSWLHLTPYEALYDKMDLVTEVAAADIGDLDDGSIFFSAGVLYVKFNDVPVAVAKANDVYTKAEINSMIGSLESLLAAI